MANTITTTERRDCIVREIRKIRHARVEELADHFHVSAVTIRSDLNYLNDKGLIIRSRGGATVPEVFTRELPIGDKSFLNNDKKEAIGRTAATLVSNGDSIILDSGTTTEHMARFLTDRSNLVVMTNGLNVANELARHSGIEVMMTGGTLRRTSSSFFGPQAEESLRNFHFDKLFLGVDGLDLKAGLTTFFEREAALNRKMCNTTSEIILVTDSSKFTHKGYHLIRPFAKFDKLITDKNIPDLYFTRLQEQGVDVVIAD